MARSSETFFGPDNRVVTQGQDIDDTDPIITGREHLFGQKRKRTRGSKPSTPAPAATVQPPKITKPSGSDALAAGSFFEVAGEAVDGSLALYEGQDLDAALVASATAAAGVFTVELALPAGEHQLWATLTAGGVTSEASESVTVVVGAAPSTPQGDPESNPETTAPPADSPDLTTSLDSLPDAPDLSTPPAAPTVEEAAAAVSAAAGDDQSPPAESA